MASLTTEVATEQIIEPAMKRKLLVYLHEYAEMAATIKSLEEAKQACAKRIGDLRAETGYQSVFLDGYKVTLIQSTTRTLDKKRYVALGGSLALLEQAFVEKPRRAYDRITLPGANDSEEN